MLHRGQKLAVKGPIKVHIIIIIIPPSGRIGKVVASHAAVARLSPSEVALIYTMHEVLKG